MTFQNPTHECDIVMKGGITSGVVYPKAILQIAKKYKLRRLGGTSAGAIAAAFAAAAEFDRAGGGFERLAKIPDDLSKNLIQLFQPAPAHRKTFDRALKLYANRETYEKMPWRLAGHLWKLFGFYKSVKHLPNSFFGLCPGPTQEGAGFPGLTNWLESKLETLAGRGTEDQLPERPLTFGDLDAAGITLRSVTTDLSAKNPVLMPLDDETWLFRKSEFKLLFSQRIVDHLTSHAERYDKAEIPVRDENHKPLYRGGKAVTTPILMPHDDFYYFPQTSDLPVLLAVRLSLSFPILLAAIPLYRRDFGLREDSEKMTPRRCWMSDGGVASNFPIHLFDSPIPSRPTFGFSLDQFDEERLGWEEYEARALPEGRVDLPLQPGSGILRPIDPISGLVGFLGAILNTARNWQDSLQSVLPGYRERIVHIALSENEGGLNLDMDKDLVGQLGEYGEIAGRAIQEKFPFEEHQWRRLLSTYAAFEEAFDELAQSYPSLDPLRVEGWQAENYKWKAKKRRDELWKRMDALVALGQEWNEAPLRDTFFAKDRGMPRPRAYLKLVPREQAGVTTGVVHEDDENDAES